MPEVMRNIAARLRSFVANRRRASRRQSRISCSISLFDANTKVRGVRRHSPLKGHTRDLSETGVSLVMPAIRIGEHYLMGAGRTLLLTLELPAGLTRLQVVAERYEKLEKQDGEQGYLIGVRITHMNERDRARFFAYLLEQRHPGQSV